MEIWNSRDFLIYIFFLIFFFYRPFHFNVWQRDFLKDEGGTSLTDQWLRLSASTAEGTGSIPGWGTKIPPTCMLLDQKKKSPPGTLWKKQWVYCKCFYHGWVIKRRGKYCVCWDQRGRKCQKTKDLGTCLARKSISVGRSVTSDSLWPCGL